MRVYCVNSTQSSLFAELPRKRKPLPSCGLCCVLFRSLRSNGNFPHYYLLSQWNRILFIITSHEHMTDTKCMSVTIEEHGTLQKRI